MLGLGEKLTVYWVARDRNGELGLFSECPILNLDLGVWCGICITLSQDILPEVTFENSPMKVILELTPFDNLIDYQYYC